MVHTKTYKNGMRLVVETKENVGIIAFVIKINNVGSAYEKQPDEAGISHLIEHLYKKSTKKHSEKKIAELLAYYGSFRNASSSSFGTQYYFKVIKEYFEKVLKLYSEMFFEPAYIVSEIETEKKVIYEEINKQKDRVYSKLYDALDENLYHNSFINNNILGTKESLEKIDVEKIKSFKEKHYTAENMVISICGDISFEQAEKLVNKFFASKFDYEKQPVSKFESINANLKDKYIIIKKDLQRSLVAILIKTKKRNEINYPALRIFSGLLGSDQNSYLFSKLRRAKGYVYDTGCSSSVTYRRGDFLIYAEVHSTKIKDVLKEIKKILFTMASIGISEKKLQSIKNQIKSAFLFANESSTLQICLDNCDEISVLGDIKNKQEWLNELQAVTIKEVNDIAKQIYCEKEFVVGAIGKDIDLKALKAYK